MKRREFITLLGGAAAAAWPLAAPAQQAGRPRRIAVLMGTVETAPDAVGLGAVLDRRKTLGWAEGVTARIDIRWSKSDLGLMRENAQALLALSPMSSFVTATRRLRSCGPSPAARPLFS